MCIRDRYIAVGQALFQQIIPDLAAFPRRQTARELRMARDGSYGGVLEHQADENAGGQILRHPVQDPHGIPGVSGQDQMPHHGPTAVSYTHLFLIRPEDSVSLRTLLRAAGVPRTAEGLEAVSYTHLDVYKRQEEYHQDSDVWECLTQVNEYHFGWLDIDCFVLNPRFFGKMIVLEPRTFANTVWSIQNQFHEFMCTYFLFLNIDCVKSVYESGLDITPVSYTHLDAAVGLHRGDDGDAGAGENRLLTHIDSPHSKCRVHRSI